MTTDRPNHQYWLNRPGEAYLATHKRRSERGATSYAAQEGWLTKRLAEVKDQLQRPIRLLDFGCGYGRIAHLCARMGGIEYFGFDFSEPMVRPLLASPPPAYSSDIGQRIVVKPSIDCEFERHEFDVVLTISVMIHNNKADAEKLLHKLIELRSPTGRLILIENRLTSETAWLNAWHAGCWAHDFTSITPEGEKFFIDEDIHPLHAAYTLTRDEHAPKYKLLSAGRVREFTDRSDLMSGVGVPARADPPNEDHLKAAFMYDDEEHRV